MMKTLNLGQAQRVMRQEQRKQKEIDDARARVQSGCGTVVEDTDNEVACSDPIVALFDGIRFHVAIHRGILINRVRDYVYAEVVRTRTVDVEQSVMENRKHHSRISFLIEALELEQQRHRADITEFAMRGELAEMGIGVHSAERF